MSSLEQIDLEIGGHRIDRQYGLWLDIWNELSDDATHEHQLVGKKVDPTASAPNGLISRQQNITEYHIPLKFWFCGKPGLALPLIASNKAGSSSLGTSLNVVAKDLSKSLNLTP